MLNQLIPLDQSEKCQFWKQVIDAQAQCGLTIQDFCKVNRITKSCFYKCSCWLKKTKSTSQIQFAEVISINSAKGSSIREFLNHNDWAKAHLQILQETHFILYNEISCC